MLSREGLEGAYALFDLDLLYIQGLVSISPATYLQKLLYGPRLGSNVAKIRDGFLRHQGELSSATARALLGPGNDVRRRISDLRDMLGHLGGQNGTYLLEPRAVRGEERIRLRPDERDAILDGQSCAFCQSVTNLQADHKVPFQIAGNKEHHRVGLEAYQPACGSCNTKKSSSVCTKCPNQRGARDIDVCRSCYWSSPHDYTHIAMVPERRLVLSARGADVAKIQQVEALARELGLV